MFSIVYCNLIKSCRNQRIQRITRIKSFINKYNWEGINFLSEKDGWRKFEENNRTIAFNFLHAKKEKIYPT